MSTRVIVFLLALVLAGPVCAEWGQETVSATTTATTVRCDASTLLAVNDGTGSIYIRVFEPGVEPEDATSSNFELKSSESIEFQDVGSISIISASTSTVRLIWR